MQVIMNKVIGSMYFGACLPVVPLKGIHVVQNSANSPWFLRVDLRTPFHLATNSADQIYLWQVLELDLGPHK